MAAEGRASFPEKDCSSRRPSRPMSVGAIAAGSHLPSPGPVSGGHLALASSRSATLNAHLDRLGYAYRCGSGWRCAMRGGAVAEAVAVGGLRATILLGGKGLLFFGESLKFFRSKIPALHDCNLVRHVDVDVLSLVEIRWPSNTGGKSAVLAHAF